MKSKIISIRKVNQTLIFFNIIAIVVVATIAIIRLQAYNFEKQTMQLKENIYEEDCKSAVIDKVVSDEKEENVPMLSIPEELKEYGVIGKLYIPKIELTTYILSDTSKELLNISVTKLCGPEVNKVGNLCITGHNYHNSRMFGNLKKLEKGDVIELTDLYNHTYFYQVYNIEKAIPKDTTCLQQETNGEREVTLITCTTGAIKRLIVKAQEIYD